MIHVYLSGEIQDMGAFIHAAVHDLLFLFFGELLYYRC